jgi:adenylate kinase
MVVVLLGPPGVGKGTQGAVLAETFGWDRIITGDLLRAARREGSRLGRQAQAYMDRGDLVPDELIVAMVRERLEGLDAGIGVLFDGFPRNVAQGEALEAVLPEVDRQVDGVLLFTAPDDVLVKRGSGRRNCPDCGRLYNVYFDPPRTEGECDDCGEALVHRSDDEPETVRHRLDVYREQTEPLVRYYRESGAVVLEIDGDQSIDDVTQAARRALEDAFDLEGDAA